jgi:membrane protease YdiL (CAAX protease family)
VSPPETGFVPTDEPGDRVTELAPAAVGGGRRDRKGLLEFVAVLFVIFVRPVVVHLLHLADPPASFAEPESITPGWLLTRIPFEIGMAVILLQLLRARNGGAPPRPTPRSGWRRELLLGLALGFGQFFAGFSFAFVAHRLGIPGSISRWDTLLRGTDARVLFSIETLFAATYEEVAFRAYLQSRLEEWMPRSELLAIVVSAGAFSLIHGYSPAGSLGVYVFGMLQGFVYRKWRRVPRLVVAHAFHNLLVTWL